MMFLNASITYIYVIINLFPSNMIDMIQKNSIFAVIIFAIAFGIASRHVESGDKLIEIINLTSREMIWCP